jgi:hypothetical protein
LIQVASQANLDFEKDIHLFMVVEDVIFRVSFSLTLSENMKRKIGSSESAKMGTCIGSIQTPLLHAKNTHFSKKVRMKLSIVVMRVDALKKTLFACVYSKQQSSL